MDTAPLNFGRLPIVTLLICVAATAVHAVPLLREWLMYDRDAIGGGELWRLAAGNLVHHSSLHFVYDVVPLFIAGSLIEIQGHRYFAALCLVSGTLIGGALYASRPEIATFGGLSGLVTASVTLLCLHGLEKPGTWRWLCLATLVCVALKISAELASGSSLFLGSGPEDFVPVPESHAIGAAAALMLFLWTRRAAPHRVIAVQSPVTGHASSSFVQQHARVLVAVDSRREAGGECHRSITSAPGPI